MDALKEIEQSLRSWGSNPVFVEVGAGDFRMVWTPEKLLLAIHERTRMLESAGVMPGNRVALAVSNGVEFIVLFFAIQKAGAIASPLKSDIRPRELQAIVANLDPHLVVAEASAVTELADELAPFGLVVRRENGAYETIRTAAAGKSDAPLDSDVVSINYTYRGYGYPLGAMVPAGQYIASAKAYGAYKFAGHPGEEAGRSSLIILPMAHMFTLVGCIFMPLLHHITGVIATTLHPRRLFELAVREGVSYVTAVPELYRLFASALSGRDDLRGRFSVFGSGGSMLTAADQQRIESSFDVELLHGYGLTEIAPVTAQIRGAGRPGTVGRAVPGVEYRLESTDELGIGEIVVRSPGMARGYFRREAETREAFGNGWFHTGDLGQLNGEDLVFIREKKRTCKVNGAMVDLREVEMAIVERVDANSVSVFLTDRGLVAKIGATRAEMPADRISELQNSLRRVMAPYKIPKILLG